MVKGIVLTSTMEIPRLSSEVPNVAVQTVAPSVFTRLTTTCPHKSDRDHHYRVTQQVLSLDWVYFELDV